MIWAEYSKFWLQNLRNKIKGQNLLNVHLVFLQDHANHIDIPLSWKSHSICTLLTMLVCMDAIEPQQLSLSELLVDVKWKY